MTRRSEKVEGHLRDLASDFLNKEAGPDSLITVTRADVSPDFKQATIFVTVLPTEKEEAALNFCKRKASEFRAYAKPKITFKNIPFFTFEIDRGERNRQRIDELTVNT